MQTPAEKSQRPAPVAGEPQAAESVWDGRPGAAAQRGLQAAIANSPRVQQAAQLQAAIASSVRVPPAPQLVNKTGLPDGLKAGVENLSGHSLDDVRVHYNSARPAQLQAHAYAQGTDIHVAPGQERYLPHEAWHVVQQKQGRVPVTLQRKGVAINDDPALEQEADAMGETALLMRRPRAAALQQAPLGAGSSTQRKVMQLTTSQLVLNTANQIVQVVVRGRPPRVHGGSMGDHTSAFIIHVEGINIGLKGKTLMQAVDYVKVLKDELALLPGYEYMDWDPTTKEPQTLIGSRFGHEYAKLQAHYAAAVEASTTNDNMALQHLQQAISAYLDARELIPFSTVNVAAKSTGLAGKGRGESTAAATLSTFERDPTTSISDFDLLAAVYKLFDDQAASMVAAEPNETTVRAMTGGVAFGKEKDAEQRLAIIWEQHQQSISNRFPKVYAKISSELGTAKIQENLTRVKSATIVDLFRRAGSALGRTLSDLMTYTQQYSSAKAKTALRGMAINQTQLEAIFKIYQQQKEALELLSEIKEVNKQLNNDFIGNIRDLEVRLRENSRAITENIAKYDEDTHRDMVQKLLTEKVKSATSAEGDTKAVRTIKHLHAFQDGDPTTTLIPVMPGPESAKDLGEYAKPTESRGRSASSAVVTTTLTRGMSPMAIQIVLNPTDNTVADMLSSGRPPSPFKGTMGAHTTAWVVHLDRVRSAIRKLSVPDAIVAVQDIITDVQRIATEREGYGLGDNAKELYADSLVNMQQYAKVDPTTSTVAILQQMINATLAFYNLIPGVSVNKINTTGHGEGTARQTLLRYQLYGQGTREELQKAIIALYDGGNTDTMRGLHDTFIEQAYPGAYKFATTGESTIARKDIPPTATVGDDTEDDEESSQLNEAELTKLEARKDDPNWLVEVNNCLINAITDGAGRARVTGEQVVRIRARLGVPIGEMLYASQRVLTIILTELGLAGQGAVVFYEGSPQTDRSTTVSANPILVYHDGVNHFTALRTPGARSEDAESTAPLRSLTAQSPAEGREIKRRRVDESDKDTPTE